MKHEVKRTINKPEIIKPKLVSNWYYRRPAHQQSE